MPAVKLDLTNTEAQLLKDAVLLFANYYHDVARQISQKNYITLKNKTPTKEDIELELDSTVEWIVRGRNLRDRTPEEDMIVIPVGEVGTISLTNAINILMETN